MIIKGVAKLRYFCNNSNSCRDVKPKNALSGSFLEGRQIEPSTLVWVFFFFCQDIPQYLVLRLITISQKQLGACYHHFQLLLAKHLETHPIYFVKKGVAIGSPENMKEHDYPLPSGSIGEF